MPEGLAEMIESDESVFSSEVTIESGPQADTTDVERRLQDEGVIFSRRRLGAGGVRLVSHGLSYRGPSAIEQFLSDRD